MEYDFSFCVAHEFDLRTKKSKDFEFETLPFTLSRNYNAFLASDIDHHTMSHVYTRDELIAKIANLFKELQSAQKSNLLSCEEIIEAHAAYSFVLFRLASLGDHHKALVRYS